MDKNPTESGKIRAASAALWALLLAFVWQSAVGAQLAQVHHFSALFPPPRAGDPHGYSLLAEK